MNTRTKELKVVPESIYDNKQRYEYQKSNSEWIVTFTFFDESSGEYYFNLDIGQFKNKNLNYLFPNEASLFIVALAKEYKCKALSICHKTNGSLTNIDLVNKTFTKVNTK
jgi:hypothetical protein